MSNHNDLSHPDQCEQCEELQDEIDQMRGTVEMQDRALAAQRRKVEQQHDQIKALDSMVHSQAMSIESLRYQLEIARRRLTDAQA